MGGIRKAIRTVGGELQEGISEAKKFVRKRARVPPRGSLAFAVVPQHLNIQAPR